MPDMSTGQGGLYADILRELRSLDNEVSIIAPSTNDGFAGIRNEGNYRTIRVPIKPFMGNIPFYLKGMRILTMSSKYKKAYNKYLGNETFDILLMATPPTTLVDVASMIKRKSGAKLYLILRDIHPECLDRKEIPERFKNRTDVYEECKKPYGVNFLVEKLLYHSAQSLYKISDGIGCMSPGNMKYIQRIAPYLDEDKLKLLPNWYNGKEYTGEANEDLRMRYDLKDKYIVIFGGAIGEAQAVWNIATLAKHNLEKKDVVFLVVGRGVKKKVLENMAREDNITNLRFLDYMPREDYERILELADVGIISIDEKYKVPTCPSKIIGYMALAKPVLAMFNEGSDYGDFYIDKPQCGLYSTDLNNEKMFENFDKLYTQREWSKQLGLNGYNYYKSFLSAESVGRTLNEQLKVI